MAWNLCSVRTAEHPYLIRSVGLKVGSIEELCFFMYSNLCLIDESIVCQALADWVRDELDRKTLAKKMSEALERPDRDISFFVLPIFAEIGYLTADQQRHVKEELTKAQVRPQDESLKLKADYLVRCGRFGKAAAAYRELLSAKKGAMSAPFYASLWNNLGCVHAMQFQFREAADCFLSGWKIGHSRELLRKYLSAIPLFMDAEEYQAELKRLGVDAVYSDQIQKMNAREAEEAARRAAAGLPEPGRDLREAVLCIENEYRSGAER